MGWWPLANDSDIGRPNATGEPAALTISDYMEVAFNVSAILVGVPINIWALQSHLRALRTRFLHSRLIWLGVHLTLANFAVLLIYSTGIVVWLLSRYWYGGSALCRLFQWFSMLAFQISSNVIVCIALDMFCTLHSPLRNQMQDGERRVRILLLSAWASAAIITLPQMFVWGEVDAAEQSDLRQCDFLYRDDLVFTNAYNFYHLLCVFYIPLAFILVCYSGSGCYVWRHLRLQSYLYESPAGNCGQMRERLTLCQDQRRRKSAVERQTRTKMRLLRKSAAVILSYVVCWMPYQVMSAWQSFCHPLCGDVLRTVETYIRWLQALMVTCACINPFLYHFSANRPSPMVDSPRRVSKSLHHSPLASVTSRDAHGV